MPRVAVPSNCEDAGTASLKAKSDDGWKTGSDEVHESVARNESVTGKPADDPNAWLESKRRESAGKPESPRFADSGNLLAGDPSNVQECG
jgi:hypothetical protein